MNCSSNSNLTPLFLAAQRGYSEIIDLLIRHRAAVDNPNKSGETPLYVAAKAGHLKVVKFLIKNGADVDVVVISQTRHCISSTVRSGLRMTPLYAAWFGSTKGEVVDYLKRHSSRKLNLRLATQNDHEEAITFFTTSWKKNWTPITSLQKKLTITNSFFFCQ